MKKLITFLLILCLFVPQAFPFSDTLDTATPSGSDSPTQGDDRIRELKRAFLERFQIDHLFPASGSTYDGATVGKHKWVHLPEGSACSTLASEGCLYVKDSGTQPEVYFRSESDGAEVQLTSDGALNVPDAPVIPSSSWRNLAVVRNSNTQITVTAAQLVLQNSAGDESFTVSSVSEAIAITTSGAGGLVSALTEGSGTWYFGYIARKSSDGTVNGFLSTSSSIATVLTQVDAGYDQIALVTAVRNDGSSNFVSFIQTGYDYWYSVWQTAASGNVGLSSWVPIDMSAYVPSALSNFAYGATEGNPVSVSITNDSSVTVPVGGPAKNRFFGTSANSSAYYQQHFWQFNMITTNTLYWASDGVGASVYVAGFKINNLG